jgi:glutamine amidotransferase
LCIAIVAPAGKVVEPQTLVTCNSGNPDGAGFAYIKDGKVELSKGFFKIGEFIPAYQKIAEQYGKDNPMLIHFRIATEGKINKANCHPFRIKGGALIHNGMLWGTAGGLEAEFSDTRTFATRMHNELRYDVVKASIEELTQAVQWNKLAMLYDNGEYVRIGKWYEDQGIWYSNETYMPWDTSRWTGRKSTLPPSCDI